MSDETEAEETAEDEAGGEDDKPSRTAGAFALLLMAGLAVLVLKAVVTAAPYTAYFVAGVLVCLGWQKARGWIARRHGDDSEEDDEQQAEERRETVAETLHRLANPHVFLADLAAEHGIATETARVVLESHGIRVRRAVRNGENTGVGVHKDDIPPLPQPLSDTPVGGVDQGQPTNQQDVVVRHGEGMTITYPGGRTVDSAAGEEAERQRVQAVVNNAVRARDEAFEEHLTDALSVVREEVNEA